jgi:ribosomal protein S27AE
MIEVIPLTEPENHKSWPKGRVCSRDGCDTILSQHNGTRRCGPCGGWQSRTARNLDLAHERQFFMEQVREVMETP